MKNFINTALFICLVSLMPFSSAQAEVKAAQLSAQEKVYVQRMEKYLNTFKNVRADFIQISDTGGMRFGKISLSRPGKMRVQYTKPDNDFIVADGRMVHMWDDEIQSQSSVPVGEGIASYILRDPLKLTSDEIVITRFAHYPNKIEVSFVSKEKPEEGELTLVFEDKPLKLRQWKILDPQGRVTGVNLQNTQEDVKFAPNTFVFVSPKFGKPRNTGL